MKPDTPVTWQTGSATLTGKIVMSTKKIAIVRSNGNLYEIEPGRLQRTDLPICKHDGCGNYVVRPISIYCSRGCLSRAQAQIRLQRIEDAILSYLIRYKSEHDGCTPSSAQIAAGVGRGWQSIKAAIERLIAAGRIRSIGSRQRWQLVIVGGKWTFEE